MGYTIEYGEFEWDEEKAKANVRKHGVSFEEATTAFDDTRHLVDPDASHPERFILIGMSNKARVIYVVHVERERRGRIRYRIISARLGRPSDAVRYALGDAEK
jgi:uncharacterized protein